MNSVTIYPAARIRGTARVPCSKPHMQRALLLSLLTNAPSAILHPAWSSETTSLFEAAQRFGLKVTHRDAERLVVDGTGKSFGSSEHPLDVAGSAFNFRCLAALACLVPGETVIEGDTSMVSRPVLEHLSFIRDLGGELANRSDATHLRVRIRGGTPSGGHTVLDTRHSSQLLTGVLLAAPLADIPVTVECGGSPVSEGYVDLTIAMMRNQGVVVERHGPVIAVPPAPYQSAIHHIASDFTALSYLAGTVVTTRDARLVVQDYHPSSLSCETEFLRTLELLGVRTRYDPVERQLVLERTAPASTRIEIDGRNIPTVVPTLAAIAPFVEAGVAVRNVAHVNNHKCRRVEVMISELRRLGCDIDPLYGQRGEVDGFVTAGRQSPAGGVCLDSHGDHRIFLSLATAALGAGRPTTVDGLENLAASYPDYFENMAGLGARPDHVALAGTGRATPALR